MTRFRFMMLFILLLIPTSAIGELMPLHEAARKGDVEEVKRLLDNGADVWAQDMGTTALYWAAFDHVEVVKVLLEHGANVWAKGTDGWTALHNAAFRGRGDIVTVLLEHGADVWARDKEGRTPRDVAYREDMIRLLDQADGHQPPATRKETP